MSGTMARVLVQENDHVKQGQLLAQLDLTKLNDAVTRSRAALAAAEASVAQARATVAEAKASLSRMRQVAEYSGGKVPAKTELEKAEAVLQRVVANEASARASVVQAEAYEQKMDGGFVSRLLPRPPSEPKRRNVTTKSGTPQVWVLDNQQPKAVSVKTGESNGRLTEIVAGDLKAGMALITEYQEAKP